MHFVYNKLLKTSRFLCLVSHHFISLTRRWLSYFASDFFYYYFLIACHDRLSCFQWKDKKNTVEMFCFPTVSLCFVLVWESEEQWLLAFPWILLRHWKYIRISTRMGYVSQSDICRDLYTCIVDLHTAKLLFMIKIRCIFVFFKSLLSLTFDVFCREKLESTEEWQLMELIGI